MRNNSSSRVGGNAPFILIIALFIIVFIVVSYFLVSGSAFGNYYVDDLDKNNNNNSRTEPSKKSSSKRLGKKDKDGNEVFHIRDNIFTFKEAKAACLAYGAKLASLDEMIEAYDRGANWCSYGWTNGQLALYPTQKEYWAKLQAEGERMNECGEPGLNGGYFENPNFKFGANCFGKKPSCEKDGDNASECLKHKENNLIDDSMGPLIAKYKAQKPNMKIAPFSQNTWTDC